MASGARAALRREAGVEQHATTLELFYDLVFVFAITQVSHLLLDRLTWTGAGQATLVLLVVWWSWNYTTWVTNELDPESIVVRLLLIGLMLGSLLMAIAIPDAFADGSTRTVLWLAALALDYGAPLVTFWVPRLPRVTPEAWEVGTEHFAERFQLFIIIALGESIVITGTTTASHELTTATIVAFGLAFLITAALWWLYFNLVAAIAERRLAQAANRTVLARDAYTYLHVVIVAGILLTAVGDEIVIAHPTEELKDAELAAVVSGPALYLLAHVLLRLRMSGTLAGRRLVGALACLAVAAIGTFAPALVVAGLLFAVLVAVIVGDQIAGTRRRQRGERSPLERVAGAPG